MMKVLHDLTGLVGNTPLYHLERTAAHYHLEALLYAKLEMLNPFGSAKDRSVLEMIRDGERKGFLKKDTTIVEPTAGNAAFSLAYLCAALGYRLIVTMPETIPAERKHLITALGAKVVLTPGAQGMKGAIEEANRLCDRIKNSFMPMQFQNPANPRAHRETTGEEIWRDTDGTVDLLVAGFGTGGTLSGCAAALKAHNREIQVIGVEPASSAVAGGGKPGSHKIPGIGAGFLPINLDTGLLDDVVAVSNDDAILCTRELALREGLLCGISSGAALHAAVQVARRPENRGKTLVVIFPDQGERYLNQGIFHSED